MSDLTRSELLRRTLVAGAGAGLAELFLPAQFLSAAAAQGGAAQAVSIANPLTQMPDRDWERIYRDQFAEDRR